MSRYKLSKSGVLYPDYTTQNYILAEIVKEFKHLDKDKNANNYRNVYYTPEEGTITIQIGDHFYDIQLNTEQKFKYENGISEPNLDKLRELETISKIFQSREEAKEAATEKEIIIEEVQKGNLPQNTQELNIYSKYLDSEISKDKGAIIAKSAHAFWPLLVLGLSIPFALSDSINNIAVFAIDITAATIGIRKLFKDKKEFLTKIKELIQEIRILSLKRVDLKEYKEQLQSTLSSKIESEEETPIAPEKPVEDEKVIKIDRRILEEIEQILKLIEKLPKDQQENPSLEITKIIQIYKAIILGTDINHNLFAETNSNPSYSFNIEEKLARLRTKVEEELKREKMTSLIDEQCESLLAFVDGTPSEECSDDLTPSVQYQKAF